MRPAALVFAGAALALTAAVAARPSVAADDAAAAAHAPVVQARKAGFRLAVASFLGIKAAIARGDDVKTLALPAGALAGWGKAIPAMFPPGSNTATSEALPTVWSDRAGFEAAAGDLNTAAAKLAALAKAGDNAGFQAQFAVVGKACGDCHTKYRKPEEKH